MSLKKVLLIVVFIMLVLLLVFFLTNNKMRKLTNKEFENIVKGMLDFAKGATIGTIFLIPAVIAFVLDLVNKDKAGSSFTKKSFPSVVSKPVLGFSYVFCLITITLHIQPSIRRTIIFQEDFMAD